MKSLLSNSVLGYSAESAQYDDLILGIIIMGIGISQFGHLKKHRRTHATWKQQTCNNSIGLPRAALQQSILTSM